MKHFSILRIAKAFFLLFVLLILLTVQRSPQSLYAAAIADAFDFPLGPPNGSGYSLNGGYDFLDWTGTTYHPGEDWNRSSDPGCNSDYGDPVYAVANGNVIASSYYTPSWGNIILIEHTLPDGTKVWSQYAHLKDRLVSGGEVARGQQIGTVGKGAGDIYCAHLHWEIRIQYRSPDFWPSGRSQDQVRQYYTDPTDFVNSHRGGGPTPIPTTPVPPPGDGVELCDGTNFGQPCRVFTEGRYANLADQGWYDRAESLRFLGNYRGNYHVVLFTETGFSGTPYHAESDVSDLGAAFRNRVRSMDIYRLQPITPTPPPGNFCPGYPDGVILFSQTGFSGEWKVFTSDNPNLGNVGFDNRAMSIKNCGYCARLYRDPDYQGTNEEFCSDDINLTDNPINSPDATTSSLRVWSKPPTPPPPPPPSAEFDAWPQSGNAPLTVSMHIVSTANISSCSWNYGDGQTGTSCDSYHDHTYTSAGSYTVRLTVSGPGGQDTMTRPNYINVSAPPRPPSANFDAWPQNGNAPLTVSMHIVSTANISSCSWDYGDGQTGTSCDPYHDHTYASAGSYTVRLTVSGPGGQDTMIKPNYINVSAPSHLSAPVKSSPPNGHVFREGEQVTLVWNSVPGATEYQAGYSGVGIDGFSGWRPSTSWDIGTLPAGNEYMWDVRARNGTTESESGGFWDFIVNLAAPSNLTARAISCGEIQLRWEDNSQNEDAYRVYRLDSYIGQVGANITEYRDTGVSGNITYSYHVKAYSISAGLFMESDPSNTVTVTTPRCGSERAYIPMLLRNYALSSQATPTPTPTSRPTATPTYPPNTVAAWHVTVPPALDGDTADWNTVPPIYLNDQLAAYHGGSQPHPVAADLSLDLRAAWDASHLYFAARIRDDVLIGNDSTNAWEDDDVELGVQIGGHVRQSALIVDGRRTALVDGWDYYTPTVTYARKMTDGGWSLEVAIPLSELGVSSLSAGQTFAFTFGYWDDDDGGGGDSHLIRWGNSTNSGPEQWGRLTLSGQESPSQVTSEPAP